MQPHRCGHHAKGETREPGDKCRAKSAERNQYEVNRLQAVH
jgi:hypothetical protein